jgi:hypothetical protein
MMRKSELIKEYERRLADKEEETRRVIDRLKRDIEELQRENKSLATRNHELHETIYQLERLTDVPDDCKMGPWCKACVYSKTIRSVYNYVDTITYCDKNNSCQHFRHMIEEKEKRNDL